MFEITKSIPLNFLILIPRISTLLLYMANFIRNRNIQKTTFYNLKFLVRLPNNSFLPSTNQNGIHLKLMIIEYLDKI